MDLRCLIYEQNEEVCLDIFIHLYQSSLLLHHCIEIHPRSSPPNIGQTLTEIQIFKCEASLPFR